MPFKTKQSAEEKSHKVLAILGDKWTGRVWDNMGWHVSWRWGSIAIHYSTERNEYYCFVGSPYDHLLGGHMDLGQEEGKGYSADVLEAVRMACDNAIQVFESEWKPIQSSVAEIRLSL